LPTGLSLRDQGFTIGGLAGFNWQVGSLVTGIEGDPNVAKSFRIPEKEYDPPAPPPGTQADSTKKPPPPPFK
jgi:hypothetical protein